MSNTPEYRAWADMRTRCSNPDNPFYADYGGRGITVCPAWDDFRVFLVDMGIRPPDKTLERKDVNAGYSPENCKWATRKEQMRNRRCIKHYEFAGRKQTLPDWADELGMPAFVLRSRIGYGWANDDVFGRPHMPKRGVTAAERQQQKSAGCYIARRVRAGHLVRPAACPTCGCDKTKIQAHHYMGYAKENWGTIHWLCVKCHRIAEAMHPYPKTA